jgi:hypothetical protein
MRGNSACWMRTDCARWRRYRPKRQGPRGGACLLRHRIATMRQPQPDWVALRALRQSVANKLALRQQQSADDCANRPDAYGKKIGKFVAVARTLLLE